MREIVQYPNPILREKCEDVKDYKKDVNSVIGDMMTLSTQNNGAGLSAPQVGWNKRFFIISTQGGWTVHINPKVLFSIGSVNDIEGCLSIKNGGEGRFVKRPYLIYVSYLNEKMKLKRKILWGFKARVFLHELDHLDGVLILDK